MQHYHQTEKLTLASAADVEAMIVTNKPRLMPVTATIKLTIPGFPSSEAASWEAKLAAQRNGCGCGMGMAFVIVATTGYIVLCIILALTPHATLNAWFFVSRVLLCLLVMFVAAGIGKVMGLVLAQYRFKRLSTKLLTKINNMEGNV